MSPEDVVRLLDALDEYIHARMIDHESPHVEDHINMIKQRGNLAEVIWEIFGTKLRRQ